ncbi:hypothetical protein ACSBR1_040703 [Camellia fascicularis]
MKKARHRRPLSESFASLSIAITSKRSFSESLASLSGRDQQTKQTELSRLPLTGALAHFLPTTQFQSRQATISVDAMLEVLQRSAEEKEKKLEEEDEALIKSLFGAPREVVRRIDDDILDDDEDLSQISTDNAETSNNNSKIFPE